MTISINTKGLDLRERELKELIKIITQDAYKKQIADYAIGIIRKRTKAGKGISDDTSDKATNTKLKPLSPLYQEYRKTVKLGEFASPKRSNLTLTGEMLDSFETVFTKTGMEININTKLREDGKTNRQVANYVRNARPFLGLSITEQRILNAEYKRIALEIIKAKIRSKGM